MKKIYIFLVLFIVILLTGCGKTQYLECSKKYNEDNMVLHQDMKTKFEGLEATYIDMKMNLKFDESYLSIVSIDELKNAFVKQYDSQYKKEGITIEYETGKDNIIIDMDFDLKKISNEDKSQLELTDVYGTISATKEAMEKQGYTCSIK